MIVKRLALNNFGIFRGETAIELNVTSPDSSIVLIGGKNGSGKTTVLHALKIALYGPLAFGVKNASDAYYGYIRDHLNIYELNSGQTDFSVSLDVELTNRGEADKYTIQRSWLRTGENLEETYAVTQNGYLMDVKETSDFDEYVRKFCPPSLFNLFFFDGEKIDEIFTVDFLNNGLRKSAVTLFNLDLFDALRKDMNLYLTQSNNYDALPQEETALLSSREQYATLTEDREVLEANITYIDQQILEKNTLITSLETEFKTYGGLLADEREELNRKIYDLETKKRLTHESIKEQIAGILPFYMLRNLLNEVINDVTSEEKYVAHQEISRLLHEMALTAKIEECLSPHLRLGTSSDGVAKLVVASMTDQLANFNAGEEYAPIYSLSWEEKKTLGTTTHDVEGFSPTKLSKSFQSINRANENIQRLRRKISESVANSQLEEILANINTIHQEIKDIAIKRQQLSQKLDTLDDELAKVSREIEICEERLLSAQKDENIYVLNTRIQRVIDRYVESQMRTNVEDLQRHFKYMFDLLIRKEDMVGEITLGTNLDNIEIKNKSGLPIPKSNLSAGETQIFILSIIWALIKCSGRELPLVFDSLLGRLDSSHKYNIITKFLPHLASQTLILSTDTEIDEQLYSLLTPYVGKEYTIDYNQLTKQVDVSNRYFFERRSKDAV